MGVRVLRAKLLGVRALSTILVVAALAQPAAAQFGGPSRSYGNELWLTAGQGNLPALTMSDNASGGTWRLERTKPVSVSLDWGRRERSIGLSVAHDNYALALSAPTCPACNATVRTEQALATYRRSGTMFGGGVMQVVEFGVGATQWSKLTGEGGSTPPVIKPNTDFTYAVALGLAIPVGDAFELSAMYKSISVRHETLRQISTGAAPNNFIGMNMLWFGARVRLGH